MSKKKGADRKLAKWTASAKSAERSLARERDEDQRALRVRQALEEHQLLATLAGEPSLNGTHLPWAKRRAMLFVNAKSGPKADSLLQLRGLVDTLARLNVQANVRVKLSKSQARKEACRAAKDGYDVVIAAGGDGTVEAVARGLMDTGVPLGIIPLGTYNNVASSLGIPEETSAACALIALGLPRPVDLGRVWARGRKRPRVFMESVTIGLGAAVMSVGQHAEKGRWDEAAAAVPVAQGIERTPLLVRLDDAPAPRIVTSLLLTASNAPRAGAGLTVAPAAHMDDGWLDIAIYRDWGPARLVQRALELKADSPAQDDPPEVQRARAREMRVWSQHPLPVAADSKVIGVTPARVRVLPGALQAIVGNGPGLAQPASEPLIELCQDIARWLAEADAADSLPEAAVETQSQSPLQAVIPTMGHTLQALESARPTITPALAALGGAAATLLTWRLRRRG